MAQRPRLPKDSDIRDVGRLFPATLPELTAEQIRFYQHVKKRHGNYVLAIDRQSDEQELRRVGHTGQVRRVEAIQAMAKSVGWLPHPPAILDRQSGELPYDFDAVIENEGDLYPLRSFWFLDGEHQNATGYAANPFARPEFWRAFQLALALAEHGIGPVAFIVGEPTRFFRDTQWLETFFRSLRDAGIRFFVATYTEVTQQTLPGLQAMVNALSEWLPQAVKSYREQCRAAGKRHHSREPFGFIFDPEDRSVVYPHPEQWPPIREMICLLEAGTLPAIEPAIGWLIQTHGFKKGEHWLRSLLFEEPYLDGYYRCHKTKHTVRKLRQRPWVDIDIRPSGSRRYLIQPTDNPLLLPIHWEIPERIMQQRFAHLPPAARFQSPLPPEIVAGARRQIRGRGRPRKYDRVPGSFVSGQSMRCAVCGHMLEEQLRCRPNPIWSVQCMCAQTVSGRETYRQKRHVSHKEAAQMPECQHQRYAATGAESLSQKVWHLVCNEIERNPELPADTENEDEAQVERQLRRRIAELTHEIERSLDTVTQMDNLPESVLAIHRERLSQRGQELEATQRQLDTLATTMIRKRQQQSGLEQLRKALRYQRQTAADEERAELLELMGVQVQAHLEEGWFKVTGQFSLSTLIGRLSPTEELPEKSGSSRETAFFCFRVQGRLAA